MALRSAVLLGLVRSLKHIMENSFCVSQWTVLRHISSLEIDKKEIDDIEDEIDGEHGYICDELKLVY